MAFTCLSIIAEFLEVEELIDEKDGAKKYQSFVNRNSELLRKRGYICNQIHKTVRRFELLILRGSSSTGTPRLSEREDILATRFMKVSGVKPRLKQWMSKE